MVSFTVGIEVTHKHKLPTCVGKRCSGTATIVGRIMVCAFGHSVAMCCGMLGVVDSTLKMVNQQPTTNMSQRVATGSPNAYNMLRPTMLRYAGLACCDRLAEALNLNFWVF